MDNPRPKPASVTPTTEIPRASDLAGDLWARGVVVPVELNDDRIYALIYKRERVSEWQRTSGESDTPGWTDPLKAYMPPVSFAEYERLVEAEYERLEETYAQRGKSQPTDLERVPDGRGGWLPAEQLVEVSFRLTARERYEWRRAVTRLGVTGAHTLRGLMREWLKRTKDMSMSPDEEGRLRL